MTIHTDIALVRAVIAAAPPGPWAARNHQMYWSIVDEAGREIAAPCREPLRLIAEFIAAARTGWPAALDEIERLRSDVEAADTRMVAVLEGTFATGDGTAQREIERLRVEVSALRSGVIWVCDAVGRVYAEQRTIRAVRQAANQLSKPFDLDGIAVSVGVEDSEIESLRAQLREMTAARDQACDLFDRVYDGPPLNEIAAIRKVGPP